MVSENPRSNQEIIGAIDAYLKVKPDTTFSGLASDPKNETEVQTQRRLAEDGTLENEMMASSSAALPSYLKAVQSKTNGEVILLSENVGVDKKLNFQVSKMFKRDSFGMFKHEMLALQLFPTEENGDPKPEYVGAFAMSLFDDIDASDENKPKDLTQAREYLAKSKKGFKIRHREIDLRYRGQGFGTKLLSATEAFVQAYADDLQEDKFIVATTAQLDVIKFFLKHGYQVTEKDRERLNEILEFLEADAKGETHPKFRRSVSNYILPKDVTDKKFVKDPQHPFGVGVNVDLTRETTGKEGSAITLIKTVAHNPKPLETGIKERMAGIRKLLALDAGGQSSPESM